MSQTSHQSAERIIDSAKELSTAPPIVFKLMSLLKRPNVHNKDIIEVIRYDENLTAKLMKLCNNAFFKAAVPVDSVDQAVLRLGNSNIMSIVAALSVGDNMDKAKHSAYINPYEIWRQSVTASIAAKNLATRCTKARISEETAFTSGLLHNIGMIVLNACELPETAQITPLAMEKSISLVEAEQEVLGTNYTEIGAILIKRWSLPDEIVEAVQYQHQPDSSSNPLTSLCHLASLCAHISAWLPEEQIQDFIYPSVLDRLGITIEDIKGTLQDIKAESSRIEAFMMVA